jgi:hypothetical protein
MVAVLAEVQKAIYGLEVELAKQSFTAFLEGSKVHGAYVQIDDPNRGVIPFEPWPHLMELAQEWESGHSQVILKARQLGVSYEAAAFALFTAMNKQGSLVIELSQGQDEAAELLSKSLAIWEKLPQELQIPIKKATNYELEFNGGGRIIALPATERAGRGYNATLVIVDEAAFHPFASKNYAAYKPTVDTGGQLLMISTASGPHGFFSDMYWATKKHTTPFEARFIGALARPGRDRQWLERTRAGYPGLPADFEREYPETDAQAFASLTGLVYASFREEKHITPDPCRWEDYKLRVAGVDFGGGDPTAVVPLGTTSSGRIHQPSEFYARVPTSTDDIGYFLHALHRQARFHAILCDPSEPVAIETLRRSGLPAKAADNARSGIGLVDAVLRGGRLTMNENCTEGIAEYPGYRWKDRVDPNSHERFATSTPVDNHADAHDARRYGVVHILKREQVMRGGPIQITVGSEPTAADPRNVFVRAKQPKADPGQWKRKSVRVR